MENLVDRRIYDIDDTGYWRRLPLAVGLGFGIPMAVVFALAVPGGGLGARFAIGLISGGFCGILFAVMFPWLLRRNIAYVTNALFNGNPNFVVEPPGELRYRLPCSWMKSAVFAVGGILYLGRDGLLFVPHSKNLKRDLAPFEMGPLHHLNLSLVAQPPMSLLWRILIPHAPKLLEIRANGHSKRFLIPQPDSVIGIIQERIEQVGEQQQ